MSYKCPYYYYYYKFADDTKIFAAVADSNAIESWRSDLRRLYAWSNDWLMLFIIDYCKVLHFGSNNAKYILGDQVLDSVSIERDLGVLIQDNLKVSEQCTKVVKNSNRNRILGMIKRSFTLDLVI